jgi:tetratricopeptide (TPR) repeat protein
MAKSNDAADRVLELAPGHSEALNIKAINYELQCNYLETARLYEAAISSNPNDPTARHWYALVHRNTGRAARGLELILEARRIDPLISAVIAVEGDLLSMLGRHEEAVERRREAAALGIRGGSRLDEGLALVKAGRTEQGVRLVREAAGNLEPDRATIFQRFTDAALDREQLAKFEQSLGPADRDAPDDTRDKHEMLALLGSPYLFEFLSDLSCPYLSGSLWSEQFREHRGTKEFFELMQRTGVVDYWREYGWPDDCASLDQELAECPQ